MLRTGRKSFAKPYLFTLREASGIWELASGDWRLKFAVADPFSIIYSILSFIYYLAKRSGIWYLASLTIANAVPKYATCHLPFSILKVRFFIVFYWKNNCLIVEKPIYVCYNITDNELLCPWEDLL